jgi:hypothetical protein
MGDPRAADGIERFVREVLGCTCPPAVFDRVETDPSPCREFPQGVRRIAIGGRLLIYLADRERAESPSAIAKLVRCGLAERDRLGMNRFRLVIATDESDRATDRIKLLFEQTPGIDDRTHLHLVDRSAVAGL